MFIKLHFFLVEWTEIDKEKKLPKIHNKKNKRLRENNGREQEKEREKWYVSVCMYERKKNSAKMLTSLSATNKLKLLSVAAG